jgi:hypothetical protein
MIIGQVEIILFSIVFPFILLLPVPTPTLSFPLLTPITGGLAGMVFPIAVGLLYGTDLVGGCVGALLSTGLLILVLAIPQAYAVAALVGVTELLALMM